MDTRTTASQYLHGYTDTEQQRLRTQAAVGEALVYQQIDLHHSRNLLEVGCGVGAQSEILLKRFPSLRLHGIDIHPAQVAAAKQHFANSSIADNRFHFSVMDAKAMAFPDGQFDAAFLCWVLEHIPEPQNVLREVHRVLQAEATVYITEVINSTLIIEPRASAIDHYWQAMNYFQRSQQGDPDMGLRLGNVLYEAGFRQISLATQTFHHDNRQPDARRAMLRFWTGLMRSAADNLIQAGLLTEHDVHAFEAAMRERETGANTLFYYSFMQASARK